MELLVIKGIEILVEQDHETSFTVYTDTDAFWGSTKERAINNCLEELEKTEEVKVEDIVLDFTPEENKTIEKVLKLVRGRFEKIDFTEIKIIKKPYVNGIMGQYFRSENIIEISADLEDTLIHELAHFVCFNMFGEKGIKHDHKFNYIMKDLGQEEYWYNG